MNIKSLFNIKNSFRYIYIFIIVINILAIYFMYAFIDKYVINAIAFDSSEMLNINRSSEDVNMVKFEKVITNIKNKTNQN